MTGEDVQRSNESARHRSWLGRGAWAIADQGLFSVANLAVNIALARETSDSAYGAFAGSFSIYLLAVAVHAAFWAEPAMVLLPGRFRDRSRPYVRVVVGSHALFCVGLTGLTGLAYLGMRVFDAPALALDAAGGLAIALAPLLTMMLLRRLAYARLRPRAAAIGGAVNLLAAGAVLAVAFTGPSPLDAFDAYTALAVGAAASSAAMAWLARAPSPTTAASGPATPVANQDVVRHHWEIGRWSVASAALAWVAINSYYLILPYLPGVDDGLGLAGTLRALFVLVMPLVQVNNALGTILLPSLSKSVSDGRSTGLRRYVLTFIALDGAYAALLGLVLARPVLHLLYGGRYDDAAPLLVFLALYPLASGAGYVYRGLLLATEKPRRLVLPYGAAAVASLVAAASLSPLIGLWGIAVAMILGAATQTGLLAFQVQTAED